MKTITLTIILFTVVFNGVNTNMKNISSNYECYPIKLDEGRCTGSAYCSACKNCSRCAHCSNGGSCGVCSGTSNNFYTTSTKKKYKSTTNRSDYYTSTSISKTYYKNQSITIYSKLINLREKPTINSKVLEQLTYGKEVTFLEKEGDWSKVQVVESGSIGYVLTKLLN